MTIRPLFPGHILIFETLNHVRGGICKSPKMSRMWLLLSAFTIHFEGVHQPHATILSPLTSFLRIKKAHPNLENPIRWVSTSADSQGFIRVPYWYQKRNSCIVLSLTNTNVRDHRVLFDIVLVTMLTLQAYAKSCDGGMSYFQEQSMSCTWTSHIYDIKKKKENKHTQIWI